MGRTGTTAVAGLLLRAVAVTGSRAASAYSLHLAADLASRLADRGFTVVSAAGFVNDAARAALTAAATVLLVAGDRLPSAYPTPLAELLDRSPNAAP